MTELATQRDLNCLSDPDRGTRKRALEKISKDVQARGGSFAADSVKQNLDLLHKPLLKCIKDPAEKCRELSVTILGALIPLASAADVEAIAGEVCFVRVPRSCCHTPASCRTALPPSTRAAAHAHKRLLLRAPHRRVSCSISRGKCCPGARLN
jgi:hypothetical protein